jgi:hypothetical protein
MVSISMIDLVTVVFQDELPILRVQAQSVDLYGQNIGIQNIYVMVNDDPLVADQIDPAWWGTLANRVRIIPRNIFSAEFSEDGWHSQQILKLLGSSLSYNRWSLVLDAKTILTQDVKLDRLFMPDGRMSWGHYTIQPIFEESGRITSELFQIDLKNVLAPMGVPFLFDNRLVRGLIAKIEHRTQTPFIKWFGDCRLLTEFILYSGYIQYLYGSLDAVSTVNSATAYRVCNICHSEFENFDTKFNFANNASILTVSIHRRAWNQLRPDQQQRYRDFLVSKNISTGADL